MQTRNSVMCFLVFVILLSVSVPAFMNVAAYASSGHCITESTVDGEFEGWDGETVVVLMNGEVWVQVEYYYKYAYKYNPRAMVFEVKGGYYMLVEGINKMVRVEQLR